MARMTKVRGLRGATTADANTAESILEATKELLTRLIETNNVDLDDIAATIFTTTQDLNAEFPAAAARQLGWEHIALMCGHEMSVPNAPDRCIRVLMLVNTDKAAQELSNVYVRGAENLRRRGMEEV